MTKTAKEDKDFMFCQKCGAPFEQLYLGGVGDWRRTITCERCFHVRRGVNLDTLHRLMAEQYDISIHEAEEADQRANDTYYKSLSDLSY